MNDNQKNTASAPSPRAVTGRLLLSSVAAAVAVSAYSFGDPVAIKACSQAQQCSSVGISPGWHGQFCHGRLSGSHYSCKTSRHPSSHGISCSYQHGNTCS